jgi:HK97 family phage portal protein
MNLKTGLQKLFGIETKSGLASPDDWLLEALGASRVASGIRVTPKSAMTCAPVRAAVQAISEGIGQLPIHVYERDGTGAKERAPDHAAYKLLHDEANPWTPAALFREQITRDACLYPNGGFARIVRVDGKPAELHRIDQESSKVEVAANDYGEPVYKVQTGKGDPVTVLFMDMLHIPSPSLNGEGIVHEAREAIGTALILERYVARLFGNGARPGSLLIGKDIKTFEGAKNARLAFDNQLKGDGQGSNIVLPGDLSYHPLTLTSVDAQFLESRAYAVQEISRVYRVPVHMLGQLDRAIQSNIEQQAQEFLNYCLMPWIKRWEGEIRLKLFTPDERGTYFAEFLLDDLVRADMAARMEAFSKAIAARILNPNEARAANNYPPYAGGDTFENPNTSRGAAQ